MDFTQRIPRSPAAPLCLLLSLATVISAQVLPNPDALSPFAPLTFNGPVAGIGGMFVFASVNPTGANQFSTPGTRFYVFQGYSGALVPYPPNFAVPRDVPFSLPQVNALPPQMPLPVGLAVLANVTTHHGLAINSGGLGTFAAEDDNAQGLGGGAANSGGRTLHHRRHHLVPTNQDIVSWLVVTPDQSERLMFSTVAKPFLAPVWSGLMEGGVLSIDYMGYPTTSAPPFASTVWPTSFGASWATTGLAGPFPATPPYPNATIYPPTAGTQVAHPQVLSDLAPNVYNQFSLAIPNGLAWVAGSQRTGDTPPPGGLSSLLLVADYTIVGANPNVASTLLGSPLSPYAEKILVWNNVSGTVGLLPQYVLVPCRDGVEIYDPTLVGVGPQAGGLVKVVASAPGKEICSNVSFFGPSPYDDSPATPYFIVLERNQGDTQQPGGGLNFIVFDLLNGSVAARGPMSSLGTLPGLLSNYGKTALDVVRGCNDIAIAPPARTLTGGWDPLATPAATAWFGAFDANTALGASPSSPSPLFGALIGVENWGLGPYDDSGLGFNAGGAIPVATNVRYFTPVRDASGSFYTATTPEAQEISYPIPVGEVSTNPVFNPLPGQGVVNQNLVAWYWENGLQTSDPVGGVGTGYGAAILDVLGTWVSSNPTYPGGILIDGTAGGTYALSPDRSQEVLTQRPLFGYINYPLQSILFAQRQTGIETFGAMRIPASPRSIYVLARFGPQTPPPTGATPWLYQKRRHTAWNPPSEIHQAVNPLPGSAGFPFTFGLDTAMTIQAGEAWSAQAQQPRFDDWVSYFVNWRFDLTFGLFPSPQGVVFPDWAGGRAGLYTLLSGPGEATTAPPPTMRDMLGGPVVGFPFYSFQGQTPLWPDWNVVGSINPSYPGLEYRPVLRSHSNAFPINAATDNNAWVGIGGQQVIKYSFGANLLPSTIQAWPQEVTPLGAFGQPSIIAAHIDQEDPVPGVSSAGLPQSLGGPGRFRVNFIHIQAAPNAGNGPGFEATYVNNPLGADWRSLLPVGDLISTEILAYTAP